MPYITQDMRDNLDPSIYSLALRINSAGELSYAITQLALNFGRSLGNQSYHNLATATGVLELTLDEWKRQLVHRYEDMKRRSNGDVY